MGETMSTANPSPFAQLLSSDTFHQLQQLLEQTAAELQGVWLTPTSFLGLESSPFDLCFVLVVAPSFSVLLLGRPLTSAEFYPETCYEVDLSFEAARIDRFIQQLLSNGLPDTWPDRLQSIRAQLGPNDSTLQSQFTLKLVAMLSTSAHCLSTEAALHQQIEQERLLNQVATQIRQSLELPVILKTAVEQVRHFLQVDRLVIYQLDDLTVPPLVEAYHIPTDREMDRLTSYGSVIHEARAAEAIPSVMNLSDTPCFVQALRQANWQRLEIADAIEDVELKYREVPCLLEFLRRAQVRAKLIAPIRLQDQLWGLLIAHECHQPRQWQESERRFLQQIAENLAIAISQAQLYAELQQQKQTLEERVIERTQALRDAMLTAQSANRAKSEFLAAVSHELRTPLACIIGMSATLQRWSKDVLTDRQQNFLQMIHESGEHLLALINDILDVSQAEAGRIVLNLQAFSLSRLALQTLKTFEGQSLRKNVELTIDVHVDPERDQFVADPHRVRQILSNLLSNAIKFTPEGGEVVLRVFSQADLAIFQVKDTGIGIPDRQIPLLFQKFQQLDSGYRREYQGTGLGLALTKQLVDLHQGWIEVESTIGVGSVFTVKLPQQLDRLNDASPNQLLSQNQKQKRIVLIEPSEEMAGVICDLLLAAGYQVVWVLEGSAAIHQLEVLLPAAVLVNVWLPDIDGHYFIRHLRQNPVTKNLKILALVPSKAAKSDANDWQEIGADDMLMQPIHPEALLQKMRALLQP